MKLLVILASVWSAFGAVGNVQVRGVTSTQAIIAYTAPDSNACTVEVSEFQSYRPLAHDVDPALFASANLDSRPDSTSTGLQRVFVVGKRRAERGLDGHWYSRALQAFTNHFFRISCSSSQATGSFLTANIALGNTFNEVLPPDPDVSSRPTYVQTGSYAWPEFRNWNKQDPAARPESVIDPQTGMLLKRLALPQDQPISYLPGTGDHYFTTFANTDGAWNVPADIWSFANSKLISVVCGSSSNATVTLATTHQLKTGSMVTLSGLTGSLAIGNGLHQVTGISGSTSFLIDKASLPASTTLTDATLVVTADAVIADDATAASYSGTQLKPLFISDQTFWTGGPNLWDSTLPVEYLTLSVKGWCGGVCAGEDAKIQACVSINGVTCWPTDATAKYQEATLRTSPSDVFVVLGTTVPLLDSWTPAGFQPLHRGDISKRGGLADIDAGGVVTWRPGGSPGTYFSPNWIAGSKINIAGADCRIVSVSGLTELRIDLASCSTPLSVPLSSAAFAASNVGFLIRKKTTSNDQINIQYAKYSIGTSQYMDFTASGSAKLCSSTLTKNTATGGLGYHCVMPSGWPLLYWVDHSSGDATYLGLFGKTSVSGLDGFDGGTCDGSGTLRGSSPEQPENYFCSATDHETPGKSILVRCTLNSTNQPGNLSTSCVNMTPGTTGRDLSTLVAEFTASDSPAFDKNRYGCSIVGQQGRKLVLGCGRSVQDTLGWTVMYDPEKISTAAGCVGSGAAGCVVAASNSWATAPARWCTVHTRFVSGNTDVVWVAGKYFAGNYPPQLDDGPYTSAITSGSVSQTPAIAAGTGSCPGGSAGCTTVTVDGEPCDTSPATNEATGANVCPKNPTWVYLQDAKVGDVFTVDGEYVVLVAKNGNQWTLQRGYGLSTPAFHSAGSTLVAHCMARDFYHGSSNWSWTWDTARDPHGLNTDGTTIRVAWDYDHPVPRPEVTLGGTPSYDGNCQSGSCYAVRSGNSPMGDPPNRYVTLAPTFSGASGTAAYIERAQDHPSWLQDNAPAREKEWLLDGRPLQPLMDISDAAMAVSGQLYKITSSTTDGDNLHRVGNNIYVVRTSPTTLVAAGNCSTGSPCTVWNDTTLVDNITQPCTITVLGGSGTVYVSRISAGGLGVTYTAGLSVSTDTCPATSGSGYPSGSISVWIWTAAAGSWAATGSENRGGSSGYFGNISRKLQPTWAYCGLQPLMDRSSAATGDVFSDTASDSYKYCVARKAGECRTTSQPGDIYVNCPNEVRRNGGSYGCMWYMQNSEQPSDICIGNSSAYLNSIAQVGFKKNDFTGAYGRTLTRGLTRYKVVDPYWHGKSLADASWAMFRTMHASGVWTEVLLGKIPPYPPVDSVVRSTFEPIPVKLSPPSGAGVNNAVIQFGYSENGPADQYYCTSRREACIANATTVPAIPFVFPSEGTDGTLAGVPGMPCANGCAIAVPAISQRVLYYQVLYRNAANQVVASSKVEMVTVP